MTDRILGEHPGRDDLIDVMRENGAVVVDNRAQPLACHLCLSEPGKIEVCTLCAGRGLLLDVPYLEDPWNEVHPNIFVGGHRVASWENSRCIVTDQFGFVVSLHKQHGYGPDDHIPERRLLIADADLDPDHHDKVDTVAEEVWAASAETKVLVRCLAGINRSALIAARAIMFDGYTADQAIEKIRAARSDWCLFNQSFVDYPRAKDVS